MFFNFLNQYFIAISANWLGMTGLNSYSLIFHLFISSDIPKSFAVLFFLSDSSCFSVSGTSKLIYLSNTSFDALQIFTAFLLGFFWGGGPELLSSSEDWLISDCEALTGESVRYTLSLTCPKDCLLKQIFPKYSSIWKWYCTLHNIQSSFKIKILSCSCSNRYRSETIYTCHTWRRRNSCRSDSWGRVKSHKGIAVKCGYMDRCLLSHRRRNRWHYEFNKLADENIKVYLYHLKKITWIFGYIFVVSLKHLSRQKVLGKLGVPHLYKRTRN